MAGIGLTIPEVALASVWLSGPLVLGLGATHMVLLALTIVVASLTVVPGRATPLQGGVHLVLFTAYLELAINPRPGLFTPAPAARRPSAPGASPAAARSSRG